MKPSVQVHEGPQALARAAGNLLVELVQVAVAQRGQFTIALSGGSTPQRLHALLAEERELPFARMHFFFGDERHVPPDHADSNFRMAKETLFDRAPIPKENIHRMEGELPDVQEAARSYERGLRGFFKTPAGELPRFDVILLGLGPDGHTASLFPGTPAIHEHQKWVVGQSVEKLKTERITLTPPVLNAARAAVFLVQGKDKAGPVREVLEGTPSVDVVPARVVQPSPGGLWWFLDTDAASKLAAPARPPKR